MMTPEQIEQMKVYKDKFDKGIDLETFYSNFSKEELLMNLNIFLYNDVLTMEEYLEAILLRKKSKNKIITFFINNYYKYYLIWLEVLQDNYLDSLISLIENKKGYYKAPLNEDFDYSNYFLEFIRKKGFALINYNKKDNTIEIIIPEKICLYVKKIVNNRDFKLNHEKYQIIRKQLRDLLSPYYIMSYEKLYELYSLIYKDEYPFDTLEETTFCDIANTLTMEDIDFSEHFDIESGSSLISDFHFDYNNTEFAVESYRELGGFPYKIFTKEEYSQIFNCTYYHKFKPYHDIAKILKDKYDFDSDEMIDFEEKIIDEYLVCHNLEKEYLSDVTKEIDAYEFEKDDKNTIIEKLTHLSKLVPVYKLKGYAYKEEEIKEMLV